MIVLEHLSYLRDEGILMPAISDSPSVDPRYIPNCGELKCRIYKAFETVIREPQLLLPERAITHLD